MQGEGGQGKNMQNESMQKESIQKEVTQDEAAQAKTPQDASEPGTAEAAPDSERTAKAEGAAGHEGDAPEEGVSGLEESGGGDGAASGSEAPETPDSDKAVQNSEKKGFFKKNKKKDKKDEKIEELTDQVRRQMAEFDNFRKRTEKEKSQMYEIGAKSIIEKVLPVVDSFERGLAAVPEESRDDAFVDGMNKIYKQMMTMLEETGVKPIEAVGKEFDPNLHNAVMQTESGEYGSGVVAQELQKGYMYRDSVVRHSMVAVVN